MTAVTDLLDSFERAIDGLKQTVVDASAASIGADVRDAVAEYALLQAHSQLEAFIEEVFYLCILDDPSVPGKPRVEAVASREHADLLIRANAERKLAYLSWLPIERVFEAAELFLDSGSPFERLRYRDVERRELQTLVTVRNAVAHPSDSAGLKLEQLARERGYPVGRAARFLLSLRSGTPEILVLLVRVAQIARALAAISSADAELLLEPERPFKAAEKGPIGTYVCVNCADRKVHRTASKLGTCRNCNLLTPCPTCGQVPPSSTVWKRELDT